MWCEMTPATYDGASTDYLIFKNTAGGGDRFATTARFQVTCQKCLRMSLGQWRPDQVERKYPEIEERTRSRPLATTA
jgi:hypothetical protein